nr:glucose 1-dehydrogenase-like [Lytechinus pictus]
MEEFVGKVVLITGASSGIGAETALEFASSGASLALVGRDEERLEKSAQDCLAKGLSKEKVLTIKADMCIEDDVKRIMDSTITHFGKLDVLSSMSLSYNITRAANDQFTRCCALDLASKGVRVNAVNPGAIETPLLTGFGVPVDQIEEVMGKLHPMGRVGQSSEVAKAIKFLASDAASFITGETLSIDGGRHVACAR